MSDDTESIQWTGLNTSDISKFVRPHIKLGYKPVQHMLVLPTPTGEHIVRVGDHIVKNCDNEFSVWRKL